MFKQHILTIGVGEILGTLIEQSKRRQRRIVAITPHYLVMHDHTTVPQGYILVVEDTQESIAHELREGGVMTT